MPSKMITDRQAQGRQVSAAIGVHAGEAAASLERHVQSVIGESIEAIEEMQLTLQRVFDAQLGSLVDTDEAHLDSEREAVGPRNRRDAARDELYSTLTEVRRLADALYGAGSLEPLGLTGPLSRRPEVLLRQARRAVMRLADPAAPRPEKLFATASVDEAEWTERLEPSIAALEQALEQVVFTRRRAESTLKAKNEALAVYDLAFGRTSRFMEALFDLSGLPSFASRLRSPVGRRGSGGGGVATELPAVEPDTPADSGEPGEAPNEAPPLTAAG
jgi:hypothetical protein